MRNESWAWPEVGMTVAVVVNWGFTPSQPVRLYQDDRDDGTSVSRFGPAVRR